MTNNFELATYSRDDLFKNLEWLNENNTHVRSEQNSAMPKPKKEADAQ
jgi:NADH-quinone oxidoreductase subunit I